MRLYMVKQAVMAMKYTPIRMLDDFPL